MKEISQLVKKRRKERKLSQMKAAELAGVSLNVVRSIEKGKSSVQVDGLEKVLKLFGLALGVKE